VGGISFHSLVFLSVLFSFLLGYRLENSLVAMSTDDAHLHALQALEGFNEVREKERGKTFHHAPSSFFSLLIFFASLFVTQAFLESYMELSPDGEYIETDQAEATSDAYLGMGEKHFYLSFPLFLSLSISLSPSDCKRAHLSGTKLILLFF
jgi:hypothetical protein